MYYIKYNYNLIILNKIQRKRIFCLIILFSHLCHLKLILSEIHLILIIRKYL